MNFFIRKHPSPKNSLSTFTKSERRQFDRNSYDFGRGLGLKKSEAMRHVIKAREFCGEEDYSSDVSALRDEIDDSAFILDRLSTPNELEPVLSHSMRDPHTGQSYGSLKSHSKSASGLKRRIDAAYSAIRTPSPSKKRKSSEKELTAKSELVRLNEKLAKQKNSVERAAQGDEPLGSLLNSKTDAINLAMDETNLIVKPVARTDGDKAARKAAEKARRAEERMSKRKQTTPEVNDYIKNVGEWREFNVCLVNMKNGEKRKRDNDLRADVETPARKHRMRRKRRGFDVGSRADAPQRPKATKSARENLQAGFRLPMMQLA